MVCGNSADSSAHAGAASTTPTTVATAMQAEAALLANTASALCPPSNRTPLCFRMRFLLFLSCFHVFVGACGRRVVFTVFPSQ